MVTITNTENMNFLFSVSLVLFFGCIKPVSSAVTCVYEGQTYPVGIFEDPTKECNTCECKSDGTVVCKCPKITCGSQLQRDTPDGCCKVCSRICDGETCPSISCQETKKIYGSYACCPECGCTYQGQTVLTGTVGHPCNRCRCKLNGKVECRYRACPTEKLECVDPTYDANCTRICPNGKTCKQGTTVIKYGELKIVGKQVCTCIGDDWYPRAYCNKKMAVTEELQKLQNRMCVADPSTYRTWQDIEELYAAQGKPDLIF